VTYRWQPIRDGRVRIFWQGRMVTTLAGARAARFLREIERADDDDDDADLLMARVTGNFKRGNERR
jgi:hypothetical protein